MQLCNAFTVDVEDYFQVSAFERRVSRADWHRYESRVVPSTVRLLELLEQYEVRGTFFVVGWVAERFPELVLRIHNQGHEIGSHSYWHRLIYSLSPEEFRDDLVRSKQVLEDIIEAPVTAYRAPSFSITRQSMWALEILAEEGFTVDSSIFPVRHDRYGVPGANPRPHVLETPAGPLVEFPPSVMPLGKLHVPVGGGGYFRLYPAAVTHRAIAGCNRRRLPFMFYVHPWEIDAQQPRIDGVSWRSRTRHYVNIHRTEAKLHGLLQRVRFGTVSESLAEYAAAHRWPPVASLTPSS